MITKITIPPFFCSSVYIMKVETTKQNKQKPPSIKKVDEDNHAYSKLNCVLFYLEDKKNPEKVKSALKEYIFKKQRKFYIFDPLHLEIEYVDGYSRN